MVSLAPHGKARQERYCARLAKARFLNGYRVHVVWCELLNDEGEWGAISLLMSTNTQLSAEEVIQNYGMRLSLEYRNDV